VKKERGKTATHKKFNAKVEDSSLFGILSAGERNEFWFMPTFEDII
jgi:hypothetical protein